MPHRHALIHLLENYDAHECEQGQRIQQEACLAFVRAHEDCFMRSNLAGHITASCWLLSPDHEHVLLTHHKKIGRWLQLGGHADGNAHVLDVALKEAYEESGIPDIKPLNSAIFDIDIHHIARHHDTPEHYHYDIRFALEASSYDFHVSEESHALAWLSISSLLVPGEMSNESLQRMARKWLRQAAPKKS